MANIYVVSDSSHDYSDAQRFGEMIFLFKEKINVFAIGKLAKLINEKLANAQVEDYLILSGNSIAGCMAFYTLLKNFNQVKLLIFSFRDQQYEARTITRSMFETTSEKVGGTNDSSDNIASS